MAHLPLQVRSYFKFMAFPAGMLKEHSKYIFGLVGRSIAGASVLTFTSKNIRNATQSYCITKPAVQQEWQCH